MKKMIYISAILWTSSSLMAMQPHFEGREGVFVPEVRRKILASAIEKINFNLPQDKRYEEVRTLLESRAFSGFTNEAIEKIAEQRAIELINKETKIQGRQLTDKEKNRQRKLVNKWMIALEIGTPSALEWIKAHPAKNEGEWNHIRDARNYALSGKSNFYDTLWHLDADWTKSQRHF